MSTTNEGFTAPPVEEKPWHAAFPSPTSKPVRVEAEELRKWIELKPKLDDRDWIVIDVRRTDFEVAFIKGAINLPAHSFYQTLPSLLPILTRYSNVVFHCQSSSGRGPRCAGWYQDALDERGIKNSEAVVLTGGIKRWVELYGEDGEATTKL
ncbi:Rhodanese-like domain-containing protein [Leucosporidium creatinivorum]|uniref:Rhodanese-like domain-containing protein n=1 Tax=Leucosporidium creatinivorum TaxID=106004 RepID=A0A1Y2G4J8_9BASI|nr:Rhodanese-like domain-containing protein [Leucosporidium creatinivorum]